MRPNRVSTHSCASAADAGAGEVVALHLHGEMADHANSVVLPFLLPDTPVVAWWPAGGPDDAVARPAGQLAIRRITNATDCADPMAAIKGRLAGYTSGDTDLAWAASPTGGHCWRLRSISHRSSRSPRRWCPGLEDEPSLDMLAGWLATRIDGPVRREVGELKVELIRSTETITLRRPQTGVTATISRTAKPDALIPLARREAKECLAEDLRRLDADEIYHEALEGIEKVQYV